MCRQNFDARCFSGAVPISTFFAQASQSYAKSSYLWASLQTRLEQKTDFLMLSHRQCQARTMNQSNEKVESLDAKIVLHLACWQWPQLPLVRARARLKIVVHRFQKILRPYIVLRRIQCMLRRNLRQPTTMYRESGQKRLPKFTTFAGRAIC